MELELRSEEHQGTHEAGGRAQGVGAPPPLWLGHGPLALILSPKILNNSEKCLRGFPGHFENFSFLHIKQHHGSSDAIFSRIAMMLFFVQKTKVLGMT